MAYAVRGTGPPLLLMSGYVLPARSLERVVDRFEDRYTCVTFDHRGSGRSRAPVMPMTTSGMARDATDVLRQLEISSAHVYGVSLGGMVAQELAIQAPHRVRTLILGGTTAGGIEARTPAAPALLRGLWEAGRTVPGSARVGLRGAVHQGWAAASHDTTARLRRIQAPTLVLHGSKDRIVPSSNAGTLARLIPGAEVRLIRGAGHLFLYDSVTATHVVRTWLDSHRAASAQGRRTQLTAVHDLACALGGWP